MKRWHGVHSSCEIEELNEIDTWRCENWLSAKVVRTYTGGTCNLSFSHRVMGIEFLPILKESYPVLVLELDVEH